MSQANAKISIILNELKRKVKKKNSIELHVLDKSMSIEILLDLQLSSILIYVTMF